MATWSRRIRPALASALRTAFVVSLALVAAAAPAAATESRPTVSLTGRSLHFYAGRLILDAQGGAYIDDGIVHVRADRILLDINKRRYVAAGAVQIAAARSGLSVMDGAALSIDLSSHKGTLIALSPTPASYDVEGDTVKTHEAGSPTGTPAEPLALPDAAGELPFAQAAQAVVHLGADVRLGAARVLVPGGRDVYLPSYVYTFSSDPGYSISNVAGAGEEIPIYFGSTRNAIDGAHFLYSSTTKFGMGLDHRIVDGSKAYDLFSISPLNGPQKTANFTWQEQINDHASQTLNGSAQSLVGSTWSYNATDGLHRSYLELTSGSARFNNFETLAWQGGYEPLGSGLAGETFSYHLRSEYGRSQTYVAGLAPLYHTAFETDLLSAPLQLTPSSTLLLSAGWRELFDNQPHRQFGAAYGATLQHRWNALVSTSLTDLETPLADYYPSLDLGTRTYISTQIGSAYYTHGDAFAFLLSLQHQSGFTVPPGGSFQPWFGSFDVRFRINPTLAIEFSRSYGFGFGGQRFGPLGFQILP